MKRNGANGGSSLSEMAHERRDVEDVVEGTKPGVPKLYTAVCIAIEERPI